MKYLTITLFLMGLCSILKAQETNLIGTWNIIEFSMTNDDNVNQMTEDSLKENNSIWDLNLLEDGTLRQTSNMRNGETEIQEGSWKTVNGNLIITLKINDRDITIEYGYELTEHILTLKRSNPMGTMSIETKFRKKV